ncbi:MAG TPA: homoserine kinase [Solirubrobacteraceae bacterium]|nr:homoserine kinase [Solirubrobacteraceae bacterium]
MRRVRIEVPGSSANLGPGYDVLAAALALHLTVEVWESGRFRLHTDLHLRRDRQNLIVRAFERVLPADRFEFRVSSTIPLSGGMGSSAAGVIAGLLAADHLTGGGADVLALAVEFEGHPDNVAASLLGGLVICDGADVRRLEMPADLEAVLLIPHRPVRTALARQAVPATVPIADAVHNLASVARLIAGLTTGDHSLIAAGLGDRLHQPHRAHLYPHFSDIAAHATEHGALGATVSGAGPTVLVWCARGDHGELIAWLQSLGVEGAQVRVVPFEPAGARVTAL